MNIQDAYLDKMNAQIHAAEAEIDRLNAKAEEADADARLTYQKHIAALKQHRDALNDRLEEMQAASSEALDDVMTGVESAWKALRDSVETAAKRF